jgi:hypothetical protein
MDVDTVDTYSDKDTETGSDTSYDCCQISS